jgi:hypothetical protein
MVFQNHLADVVVQTWMGTRIYVYVVDSPPRTRDLRHILRDNTRASVGTLFLLDAKILPSDGSVIKLDDWLIGLQHIYDGGVYAYHIEGKTASLVRVSFSTTGNVDEYYCWYTADFQIESVTTRRREVTQELKGVWQIADIASPSFKRRINYERLNQRHHYRTRDVHEAQHPVDNKKFMAYCKFLDVSPSADEDQVKQAYRKMALQVHPDVSALPQFEADKRFKMLQEAYDYIRQHQGWT